LGDQRSDAARHFVQNYLDFDRVIVQINGIAERFRFWPGNEERGEIHYHQSQEEEHMSLIMRIVVGGVIGWLASIIMKTNRQMGILANIVVGIIGSWLGFWLANMAGLSTSSLTADVIVSIVGAALLIFILKSLKIMK
jgi:uncharacterized membrane protein YeaQ/YmgE (transglycosylase-associated protein family)